ncbi:MAG: STAS domain-containing protein [Candidatus Mcinerneyibacterium aminivorans]|uniref:Anti-sigma factor antagonist n=1 Tax=Candidatus Mcinerneyibacterium aminivorans TaxID=2703815 RepID=A0A5D0MCY8_9BACT|nr:MAG: STAS domain-containing protein [Candidatus Mcinerneyibacterium aminivorans]
MPNYEANYEKIEEDIIKINLKGFLDAHTASDFEDLLTKLIDDGNIKFLVDLNELDYISSTGLGVFMGYIEQIRDKGGDIKFVNVPKNIYKIFSVLGFSTIYEIYDKKDKAVKNF